MADTVLEVFENRVHHSSTRPALRRRVGDLWQPLSWKEWWHASERVAAGLIDAGVGPGDRVAIISRTRSHWPIADIGIMMAGAVTVPVYPSLDEQMVGWIIANSGASTAIVSGPGQLDKLAGQRQEKTKGLARAFWMDAESVRSEPDQRGRRSVRLQDVLDDDDPWNRSMEDLAARGRRRLSEDNQFVARRRRAVGADDLATIVYTSGTTGMPRGVMLTHRNLVAQIEAMRKLQLFEANDVQYLFLPLAHTFARVLYLCAIGYGLETALVDDPRKILWEMQQTRPTFFAAVPHVFEQVRSRLESQAARHGGVRKTLFETMEQIGREADRARREEGGKLVGRLRDLVFSEWSPGRVRSMFGGEVRFAISGGAPMSSDTSAFFGAFGLDVLEGYGLTETTAVATVNLPDDNRQGTVGRPTPGVDITIDEDGEVLIRGETVSPGYWRDEAATRASRDEEGWFRTGDLGAFDRDGFLSITGRKKELIVTSGGKNVAPSPIEASLETLPVVDRAYVHGDRRPFVVALLTLREDVVRDWAERAGVPVDDASSTEQFERWLTEQVATVNSSRPGYAVVRRWAVVDAFTEKAGELTATGKLRRQSISQTRSEALESLYRDQSA
jgi:long-chain acyl-CoA synthetase